MFACTVWRNNNCFLRYTIIFFAADHEIIFRLNIASYVYWYTRKYLFRYVLYLGCKKKTKKHVTSKMSAVGVSKKLIRIPNCDKDEAPEDLLDTLDAHLKQIDGNI